MWIDILLVIVIIISLWKGWQQGLIITIFTMLAWILGIIAALKLCTTVSILLRDHFNLHSRFTPVISFIVIFLIIAITIAIIGKLLTKVIEVAQMGFINRALGAIVRVIILTFVFSLFIWLVHQAGMISPEKQAESKTYSFLESYADHGISFAENHFPAVKNIFDEIGQYFQNVSHEIKQSA